MKIKKDASDIYSDSVYYKRHELDFTHHLSAIESINWIKRNEGRTVDDFCVLGDGTTMVCIEGHGEIVDSDLLEES